MENRETLPGIPFVAQRGFSIAVHHARQIFQLNLHRMTEQCHGDVVRFSEARRRFNQSGGYIYRSCVLYSAWYQSLVGLLITLLCRTIVGKVWIHTCVSFCLLEDGNQIAVQFVLRWSKCDNNYSRKFKSRQVGCIRRCYFSWLQLCEHASKLR